MGERPAISEQPKNSKLVFIHRTSSRYQNMCPKSESAPLFVNLVINGPEDLELKIINEAPICTDCGTGYEFVKDKSSIIFTV